MCWKPKGGNRYRPVHASRPRNPWDFGVLQGGPLPCYIFVEFFGFVYKWPKFFFGLTGEIFFRPTKKRPYFTPMFITIVGTHLVKCPIHPAVDSLKKKSPFILEFPIYLDPADSYLWRRVTVPKNPKMFFWGQICKLANWKRVV